MAERTRSVLSEVLPDRLDLPSSDAPERASGETDELPAIWQMIGEASLSPRLLVLAKMIDRETSRKLQSEFGLSVAQWRVLAFVCISGPATASYIGDAAEADPAEVSRAVKALVAGGFVSREFEPGSRKAMIVAPTAEGRELFHDIRSRRQAYFSRITRRLSAAQVVDISRSLTQIAQEVVAERGVRRARDRAAR